MDFVATLMTHATEAERRAYPHMTEEEANRLLGKLKQIHFHNGGLSSTELRLDLAEAEAERPETIRGVCLKKNRIRALTAELVARGSF